MKTTFLLSLGLLLLLVGCKKENPLVGKKTNGEAKINGKTQKVTFRATSVFINGIHELSLGFSQFNGLESAGGACINLYFGLRDTISGRIGECDIKTPIVGSYNDYDCDVPICSYRRLDTSQAVTYVYLIRLDTAAKVISYAFSAKFSLTDGRNCTTNRPDSVVVQGSATNVPLTVQVVR